MDPMINSRQPVISIVTPSFNQGAYVRRTVRSVLEQRYPKLEYIFMDGGSTDDTLQQISPFLHLFSHFESAPDGGQSAAIAKGFELTSGEIMAFLNSDDVLLPGTLNFVADFFAENPNIDFIYSHRCILNDSNEVIGHWILPAHSHFMMRRWDLIPQETCFWRRSLYEQHGNVDPSLRFAMDYDLFVRFMKSGNFKRVNRFLAAFRVHMNAKTSTQLATIGAQEIEHIQNKYNISNIPLLGDIFSMSVQLNSALWLRNHKSLPGLPPGNGYNLDIVWA
jgi:glycosyltransferase involved in cell wall biosynthesis